MKEIEEKIAWGDNDYNDNFGFHVKKSTKSNFWEDFIKK